MIGLSSPSLDSYILLKDAAGFIIKDLLFLVWSKNSFSLGNLKEFQCKLRDSPRGSQVLLDLSYTHWDNDIIKIDFYNDGLVIADNKQLSVWNQKSINVTNLHTFSLNPEFKTNICATLSTSGQVSFYDLVDMTMVDLPCDNVSYSMFDS